MAYKRANPRDLTKTLPKGRSVSLLKIKDTWRLIGAAGEDLFFLAEFPDAGVMPSGVVHSQLTEGDLFGRRVIDDRSYTVVAHGGRVEMDGRGYKQRSA